MKIDLKIGGAIIPLYFGMIAFEEMQKLVSSYMGTNKYATDVVWAGYLNHCAVNSMYPEMTYGDVMKMLEDHFFSDGENESNLNDVLDAFDKSKAGSMLFNVVDKALDIINDTGEEIKKKTVKKRAIPKSKR